jgi:hypothetical protein
MGMETWQFEGATVTEEKALGAQERMREEFEKWATPRSFQLFRRKTHKDEYEMHPTDYAWQIWQAAYAASLADSPSGTAAETKENSVHVDAKCPVCGSDNREVRKRSTCVMSCPPQWWRWVKDERANCFDDDSIECDYYWHDSTFGAASGPSVREKEPEWILTKDRMPEKQGEYWVWLVPHKPQPSSMEPGDSIFTDFKPYARKIKTYMSREGKLRFNCGATEFPEYWRRLPAPPKTEASK